MEHVIRAFGTSFLKGPRSYMNANDYKLTKI
jgi:hypothetical protein